LNGDVNAVRQFLRTYAYTGQDNDYRARVNQILSTGGPTVRNDATAALNTGTLAALTTFLATKQYTARQNDLRIAVVQLLDPAVNGPEVRNAATVAMRMMSINWNPPPICEFGPFSFDPQRWEPGAEAAGPADGTRGLSSNAPLRAKVSGSPCPGPAKVRAGAGRTKSDPAGADC